MATKKTSEPTETVEDDNWAATQIETRRKAKREATTVDGTESFPPPGMDLPDGGTVPLDVDEPA